RLRAQDAPPARPDLPALLVVDAAARQWPHLLEPDAAREWQPLEIAIPLRRERASHYRLALPVSPVRLDQIVLDTDTPFFDRAYRLTATLDDERASTLAQGRLVQRIGPPPANIALPPARVLARELA